MTAKTTAEGNPIQHAKLHPLKSLTALV